MLPSSLDTSYGRGPGLSMVFTVHIVENPSKGMLIAGYTENVL